MFIKIFSVSSILLWSTTVLPCELPVLGSVDPDVIRNNLLEQLPKFRYCYQKEIEKVTIENNVVVDFNFTVNPLGIVSSVYLDSVGPMNANMQKCLLGVLISIDFPEPFNNGIIDVHQKFNFYLKEI